MKIRIKEIHSIKSKITLRTQITYTDDKGKRRCTNRAFVSYLDESKITSDSSKWEMLSELFYNLIRKSCDWVIIKNREMKDFNLNLPNQDHGHEVGAIYIDE